MWLVVRLSKDIAEDVINSRCFSTNTHKLANRLQISDADARNDIYYQFTQKRLKDMAEDEFIEKWNDEHERKVLEWKITYSRQDVQHQYYSGYEREDEKKDRLKVGIPTLEEIRAKNEPAVIPLIKDDETKLLEFVMEHLEEIFPNSPKKIEMITNIVNHTKVYTRKQITNLLSDIRKVYRKKRDKLDELYSMFENKDNIRLLELTGCILKADNQGDTIHERDMHVADTIKKIDDDTFSDLMDKCVERGYLIKNQSELFHDWMHADATSKNNFIHFLKAKRNELKEKLSDKHISRINILNDPVNND